MAKHEPLPIIQGVPNNEPKAIFDYKAKGAKLRTNRITNAFIKSSLGSIPSSQSVLLYYDPTIEPLKAFNSKAERFPLSPKPLFKVSPQTNPSSYLNPIQEKKDKSSNQLNINYSPRFENKDLFISKHLPGPGEYNANKDISDTSYNNRYKSLYCAPYHISSSKSSIVGPGYYNSDTSLQKNSNFYMSSLSRSDIHALDKPIPGPGTYNLLPISIKKKSSPSFFFKDKELQKADLVEKYLGTQSSLKSISPGPGAYDLAPLANVKKDKKRIAFKYFSEIKSEIAQSSKDFIIRDQHTENNLDSLAYQDRRKAILTAIYNPSNVYIHHSRSGEKKVKDTHQNHHPGPCYYSPTIPSKKKYNKNKEHNWI